MTIARWSLSSWFNSRAHITENMGVEIPDTLVQHRQPQENTWLCLPRRGALSVSQLGSYGGQALQWGPQPVLDPMQPCSQEMRTNKKNKPKLTDSRQCGGYQGAGVGCGKG